MSRSAAVMGASLFLPLLFSVSVDTDPEEGAGAATCLKTLGRLSGFALRGLAAGFKALSLTPEEAPVDESHRPQEVENEIISRLANALRQQLKFPAVDITGREFGPLDREAFEGTVVELFDCIRYIKAPRVLARHREEIERQRLLNVIRADNKLL